MSETTPIAVTAGAMLPTRHGDFQMETFRCDDAAQPHLALSVGLDSGKVPLVRVHSECITGEVFGSRKCDCGEQLDESMRRIQEAGCGVIIYLRQEGRGIGIENKLRAYALQETGLDTVDANVALGLPVDARSYAPAVAYLKHCGVRQCVLLTNNPDKREALTGAGITVTRAPLQFVGHEHSEGYLESKRMRLGHDV